MKPLIYLAAQFHLKDDVGIRKEELVKLGYQVISTWTEEAANGVCSLKDFEHNYHLEVSERDIREIDQCDILVLFTVDPDEYTRRGGRHFESGYAYGINKRLVIIGPRENIFHYLPGVDVYDTWEQFVGTLENGVYEC